MKGYEFYYHRNNIPMETYIESKLIGTILINLWNCKYNDVYSVSENDKYFNSIVELRNVKSMYILDDGIRYKAG